MILIYILINSYISQILTILIYLFNNIHLNFIKFLKFFILLDNLNF